MPEDQEAASPVIYGAYITEDGDTVRDSDLALQANRAHGNEQSKAIMTSWKAVIGSAVKLEGNDHFSYPIEFAISAGPEHTLGVVRVYFL